MRYPCCRNSAAALRERCVAPHAVPEGAAVHPLKGVLHDLCRAVAKEQHGVTPSALAEVLAKEELLPADALPALQSNLADVLWFMGLELETASAATDGGDADGAAADARKQYVGLIGALVSRKLLGAELLLSRLENDVLQEVGLIKDASELHKKQVKMNTRALYTQQKYNLFREETEGYSKLIAELSELPAAAAEHTSTRGCKSAHEVIQNLRSLIGYFDLDPNRVLDLVLEALEAVPSRVANSALVTLFNPGFIPHMVGFKFALYASRGAPPPPESLYNMCALLLSHGSVRLEQLLPHLSPTAKGMADLDAKRVAAKVAEARSKFGTSLLGGGGGDRPMGGRKSLADFGSLDDPGGPSAAASSAAADEKAKGGEAADAEEEEDGSTFEKLQPLGVMRALLKLHDWPAASKLMAELDGVDVAGYPPIADAYGYLDDDRPRVRGEPPVWEAARPARQAWRRAPSRQSLAAVPILRVLGPYLKQPGSCASAASASPRCRRPTATAPCPASRRPSTCASTPPSCPPSRRAAPTRGSGGSCGSCSSSGRTRRATAPTASSTRSSRPTTPTRSSPPRARAPPTRRSG